MMDSNDPPIESKEFLSGVKVVDIGDYRVARGKSRRPFSSCAHLRMVYDKDERRIWCEDCKKDVSAFDAFESLIVNLAKANDKIRSEKEKIKIAKEHNLISIASKVIDDAWRQKKLVPCCPHCREALFPDDFKRGASMIGKSYALEERCRKNDKKGKNHE